MVGTLRAATPCISNAVGIVSFALLLFAIPDTTMAQVLRDPPTPYHFLRYDDTPDDQKNPAWPKDIWQPIKFIALDLAPGSYINFGGEIRERFEYFSAPFFGLTPRRATGYDLHRLLLEGDLHLGDSFRTFIQLGNHLATSPSMSPPTDFDRLDLQQGFADLKLSMDPGTSLTLRGGRHEMTFGSGRLVDVREGPNIRLSFDGARTFYESPDLRLDAFVTRPFVSQPGYFDDYSDPTQAFWGLYGVIPVKAVPGLNVDLYYLGLDRDNAVFDSGTADERRHSVGTRLWGRAGAWDYDTEAVFQFGEFGTRDIRAWTIASNTGYTLKGLWGEPRLGLQADVASGGGPGGTLETFYPLFPKFAYFTEAAINAPMNFIDLFPSLTVQPTATFAVTSGIDFLWRYSVDDAFYQPPGVPLVPGNANDKRYLGAQSNLHAEWQPSPHLNVHFVYVHFFTEGFLQAADARDIDFIGAWMSYKF